MEHDTIDYVIQGFIAVGTVGTLIAALFQIWRDRSLRLKEKRKEQAVNVAAWFEDVVLSSEYPGNQNHAFRSLLIRNDNLTPIYDVVITVVGLHGAGPHRHGECNEGDFAFRTLCIWCRCVEPNYDDSNVASRHRTSACCLCIY